MVCLDHAEGGVVLALVHSIQPPLAFFRKRHIFWHKLKVFDAALGNDQLDILDFSRRGIACELADLGDIVVKEPILQVGVEGAGLEETVTQKHHAVFVISVFKEYACIKKCLAVPDHVLDLGFFFLCHKVVRFGFLHANSICREATDAVTDDEDGFLGKLDGVLDATECQCDIRLPRGLVGGGISRQVARAPRHHIGIERLGNEEATTVTARACTSFVANVVNSVDIEAVGVEVFTDLLTGNVGGDGLVASLVRARFGIVFEILTDQHIQDGFFHGGITVLVLVGHLYGNQRRLAVHASDADVVFHIRVGHAVTVQNVAVAVGLVQLDGAVEGKVHNGAAE